MPCNMNVNIICKGRWRQHKGTCCQALGPTWWKERTNCHKLSPDLYLCTMCVPTVLDNVLLLGRDNMTTATFIKENI